jgi:hypothetical protein
MGPLDETVPLQHFEIPSHGHFRDTDFARHVSDRDEAALRDDALQRRAPRACRCRWYYGLRPLTDRARQACPVVHSTTLARHGLAIQYNQT